MFEAYERANNLPRGHISWHFGNRPLQSYLSVDATYIHDKTKADNIKVVKIELFLRYGSGDTLYRKTYTGLRTQRSPLKRLN